MNVDTSNKPLASFGIDWIYVLFIFIYGAVLLAAFDIIEQLEILVPLILASYLLTLQLLRGLVPKFELFEDGIQITHHETRTKYQWCDIKSVSGTRHYHSFNFLPTFRYGANHFSSSKGEVLFSISAFVINANALFDYLLIKMIECSINDYVSRFESDDAIIYIGNIQLNLQGIEHAEGTYHWSQIKHAMLKKKDDMVNFNVLLDENKKYTLLGKFTRSNGILLMGLIDHFTHSNYLGEIASDTIDNRKKMMVWANRLLIIAGIVLLFVVFVEIINHFIVSNPQ